MSARSGGKGYFHCRSTATSGCGQKFDCGLFLLVRSCRQGVYALHYQRKQSAFLCNHNPATTMDPEEVILEAEEQMEKALAHMHHEFSTLHTGKATPGMVDAVLVHVTSYGTTSKLRDISAITTPDARCIQIQPWDRNTLKDIEKAIQTANIGLNPSIQGTVIRIHVPELSGERRKELARVASTMAEQGRVAIRHCRHEALEPLKKAQKASVLSEDQLKRYEKEVQDLHDKFIEQIKVALAAKEKDLTNAS
jgi:ribosome recycling factor